MSCHLWNINKKFVSILKIKINDLEGHAPKGTFKIYLDILIAIRKKKNKQTRKLLILKRNIGKKLKTEPYWKWVIWFTSQQRDLDRIRFTTLCCKLFLFFFFFPRVFVYTEVSQSTEINSQSPSLLLSDRKAGPVTPWSHAESLMLCDMEDTSCYISFSAPYLIGKSVCVGRRGEGSRYLAENLPHMQGLGEATSGMSAKKRPFLSSFGQNKGLSMSSSCVAHGEWCAGECPPQLFFSPHLQW